MQQLITLEDVYSKSIYSRLWFKLRIVQLNTKRSEFSAKQKKSFSHSVNNQFYQTFRDFRYNIFFLFGLVTFLNYKIQFFGSSRKNKFRLLPKYTTTEYQKGVKTQLAQYFVYRKVASLPKFEAYLKISLKPSDCLKKI